LSEWILGEVGTIGNEPPPALCPCQARYQSFVSTISRFLVVGPSTRISYFAVGLWDFADQKSVIDSVLTDDGLQKVASPAINFNYAN
jgi:hypothetical protein